MRARTLLKSLAVLVALAAALVGCAQPEGILRQIQPGQTVWIDGWVDNGERGDQALIEQKPSGWWVVPTDATYTLERTPQNTVKVTAKDGTFVVDELGGVQVGKDHDDCLAAGEHYAKIAVPDGSLKFEPEVPEAPDGTDTDCLITPEAS